MIIDLTMNLMNRTAVYDIGEEIARLSVRRRFRYWRAYINFILPFKFNTLISISGKALSRIVIDDLCNPSGSKWRRPAESIIFIDPLFSMKTDIRSDDIVICHDIAPVTNPEYFDPNAGDAYHQAYLRIQMACPRMVFISEFTRGAFLNCYPADYSEVEVVPLFFKPGLATSGPLRQEPRMQPYFLMVGGLERRKNFMAAADAFEKSGLAYSGYELLIVGPRGNLSDTFLSRIAGSKSIHHLGYTTDAELAALYRGAVALFFPSLLEGFGVPAIEAPRLGVPAIVSRGTVLEEIVGPDGILVDPRSVDDMADTLARVAEMSPDRRRAVAERICHYQSQYSLDNFRENWRRILRSRSEEA